MNEVFRKFSHMSAAVLGSSWAFIIALVIIIVWAITGPIFHFSDTWQLVINTGTTIVTFLMVFPKASLHSWIREGCEERAGRREG